jgi:hypothetical protein
MDNLLTKIKNPIVAPIKTREKEKSSVFRAF